MESYRFKVIIGDKGKERLEEVVGNEFTLGRSRSAGICVPLDVVSREQLKYYFDGRQLLVEELGSSNGTWIDNKRIVSNKKIKVNLGQKIYLGSKDGPYIKIEAITTEREVLESVPDLKIIDEKSFTKKIDLKETLLDGSQKRTDRILQIKSESEQKLFENIRIMLGNEAEEIRNACLEEASRIKKNAEEYSFNHSREAREKADKILKEADDAYFKKMSELKNNEDEYQRRLDKIRDDHFNLEQNVQELKESEYKYRNQLSDLESRIKNEEARIQVETQKLENSRSEFQKAKVALDISIEENEIAIRRSKAKIETEELEAKVKITQAQADLEKLDGNKKIIETQLNHFRQEKQLVENTLFELKKEIQQHDFILSETKSQRDQAYREYEQLKSSLLIERNKFQEDKDCFLKLQKELEEKKVATEKMIEELKLNSELALVQANDDLLKLESRKSQLSEEVETHYKKLKEDQEKVLVRLGEKKSLLIKEMERIAIVGHEEYHKIISQGKSEVQAFQENAQLEILDLKNIANAEIESSKNIFLKEMDELRNNTQNEVQAMLEEATLNTKRMTEKGRQSLLQAKEKAKELINEAHIHVQKEKDDHLLFLADIESKKMLAHSEIDKAQVEKERILSDASQNAALELQNVQVEKERVLYESNLKATEILNQAEAKVQELRHQILEKAKDEAKEILAKSEEDFKASKIKQQNILAELKHVEMLQIKSMKEEAENEWLNKRNERARTVATNVFALVASEMYKARNKILDEHFVDTFSKELKELIVDTMLDRVGTDSDKLQNILKTSGDAKNKERRFWKKVQITAVSAVLILAVVLIFPQVLQVPRNLIVSAFSKKESNSSDQFLEKVKQLRVKAIYAPEQTPELKDTYVDNVLFTKGYEEKFSDAVFQDKWILDLNDWFIRDLDVKDTTIVKFVSLESGLVKELGQMKLQIEVENPTAGIELMRKKEDEYKQKLSELFGDPNKVSRFYEYSAKFWNNYYNPRIPANTSQEFVDPVNVE